MRKFFEDCFFDEECFIIFKGYYVIFVGVNFSFFKEVCFFNFKEFYRIFFFWLDKEGVG